MPEGSSNSLNSKNSLNSNHERRLSLTCRYIDKLLVEIKSILSISWSRLAFPQFRPGLTSAQRRATIQESARGALHPRHGARPCANLNTFFRATGLAEVLPF
jgi:hypothetical protein